MSEDDIKEAYEAISKFTSSRPRMKRDSSPDLINRRTSIKEIITTSSNSNENLLILHIDLDDDSDDDQPVIRRFSKLLPLKCERNSNPTANSPMMSQTKMERNSLKYKSEPFELAQYIHPTSLKIDPDYKFCKIEDAFLEPVIGKAEPKSTKAKAHAKKEKQEEQNSALEQSSKLIELSKQMNENKAKPSLTIKHAPLIKASST